MADDLCYKDKKKIRKNSVISIWIRSVKSKFLYLLKYIIRC